MQSRVKHKKKLYKQKTPLFSGAFCFGEIYMKKLKMAFFIRSYESVSIITPESESITKELCKLGEIVF